MEKSTAPHNGTGPSKESSSQSFDDSQRLRGDNGMSPPPVGSPPQMYYPPPTGYPNGYPQGYPPGPYPYNYGGGAPPPYYAPQTYHADGSNGRGFIRGFILCSCIMFTMFFVSTLLMALAMHPVPPIYKVVSLSVDNFNTTTPLSWNWSTVVSVENPNTKLNTFFSDFKVALAYQGNEVAQGSSLGFELDTHENKQLGVSSTASGAIVDLSAMAKEREGGSLTFSIKMSSIIAFKSSSVSTRGEMILALCDGLKVVFSNNSNSGTFNTGNNPIVCKLFI